MLTSAPLTLFLAGLAVLGAAPARRQATPAADRPSEEGTAEALRPERALLDLCEAADGEAGADALLLVLESGKVRDPKLYREALDAARARALEAEQRFRRTCVSAHADSRAGYVDLALRLREIDRLSLLSRSIDLLVEKDPAAAVIALSEIPPDLGLEDVGCRDALVPEPSRFYATLGHVVEKGFAEKQRARGEHVALAREYLAGIRSPAQVPPAAKFLVEAKVADDERAALARDFAGAIARLPGSDRLFTAAMTDHQGLEPVVALADRLGASTARKEYVSAIRTLAVRSLDAPRCDDSFAALAGKLPDHVAALNARLFTASPITLDELQPLSHEPTFDDLDYWATPKSAEALERFRRLRGRVQNGEAAADPAKWKLVFDAFVAVLRAWKADDEGSDSDFFGQRALMHLSLIEIAPDDPSRADAIAQFVAFARQNHNNRVDSAVWNCFVTYIVMRAPKEVQPEILDAYAASGDPILQVYAGLQKSGVKAFPGL